METYGCVYCENPGTPQVRTPMVRDWPPRPGALRTHDSFLHNARQAISTGEAVCAVFISTWAFSNNNSANIWGCNVECHASVILYMDRQDYSLVLLVTILHTCMSCLLWFLGLWNQGCINIHDAPALQYGQRFCCGWLALCIPGSGETNVDVLVWGAVQSLWIQHSFQGMISFCGKTRVYFHSSLPWLVSCCVTNYSSPKGNLPRELWISQVIHHYLGRAPARRAHKSPVKSLQEWLV